MKVILLFIIAVVINAVTIYLQRKSRIYTRLFGKYDWFVHVTLLSVVWGLFVTGLILTEPPTWKLPAALRPFGVLSLIGIYLIIATGSRLGTAGILNGWFFGRGPKEHLRDGIFRLKSPMYTGFAILFAGAAFWQENSFYLLMAALSFLLLNVFQARIEQPSN